MPTLLVNTNEQPVTLQIGVKVKTPQKIYIKVVDADKPLTSYTNRFATIEDCNDFFVRMPISPRRAKIIIKSENELEQSRQAHYAASEGINIAQAAYYEANAAVSDLENQVKQNGERNFR